MVEITTAATQLKIAELLHDLGCASKPTTHEWDDRDACLDWPQYLEESAAFLGKLMPVISTEMFPTVRDDLREKLALLIDAELICCDLYERMNSVDPASLGLSMQQWSQMSAPRQAKALDLDYHSICHWAGYARSLVLNECPSGKRRCDPVYFCPSSDQWESPCHGGFDTCCDAPELHQTIQEKPCPT